MGKVIAKPNLIPTWKIIINDKSYYILENKIEFFKLEQFAKEAGVILSDDIEPAIGEWILDKSNWINGNFHIWAKIDKDNTYWIEVICIMYKEDFE